MLLRTSPGGHAEALSRFDQLLSQHADPSYRHVTTALRAIDILDLIVHEEAGRRRRFPRGIDHGALGRLWAPADEARAAYEALDATGPGTWGPDVRRVHLAGKDMLERETGWVDRYARSVTTAPATMLETFGLVNDPRTVSLVVRLHARRPLAKRVEAWLRQHADLSRPALANLSQAGPLAERAATLLAKL
jgi:hypothetical protein